MRRTTRRRARSRQTRSSSPSLWASKLWKVRQRKALSCVSPIRRTARRSTVRNPLVLLVLLPVLLKVRVVEVFLQRAGERQRRMLDVRYWDVEHVVELLGRAEVGDDFLRVAAEGLVDLERGGRIDVRHAEEVLEDVDDALVDASEEDEEVLDEQPESRHRYIVVDVLSVELSSCESAQDARARPSQAHL